MSDGTPPPVTPAHTGYSHYIVGACRQQGKRVINLQYCKLTAKRETSRKIAGALIFVQSITNTHFGAMVPSTDLSHPDSS
jgi:hypothetical protein